MTDTRVGNTRPPGPRTGYAHPKCYAAPLADCDDKITREHPVSESLLEEFGGEFIMDGTPWAKMRLTKTKEAASKVLCERHNSALSPLDSMIPRLFRVLRGFREGRDVGWHTIDGEDLERWAMKAAVGYLESDNILDRDATTRITTDGVPEWWLRYLFGEQELPMGIGMHVLASGIPEGLRAGLLTVAVATYPEGHAQAGMFHGVYINLVGLLFLVTVEPDLSFMPDELVYRPLGIQLGHAMPRGCVCLRWQRTPSREHIILGDQTRGEP